MPLLGAPKCGLRAHDQAESYRIPRPPPTPHLTQTRGSGCRCHQGHVGRGTRMRRNPINPGSHYKRAVMAPAYASSRLRGTSVKSCTSAATGATPSWWTFWSELGDAR